MAHHAQPRPGDILVIDDEELIRALISEVLTDEGYHVRSAANSVEALMAIFDRRPALVLLDLLMPDLPGAALLAEIRAREPDLPIVLITATPKEAEALVAQYDVACVAKPFELTTLLDCVAHYVQPDRAAE